MSRFTDEQLRQRTFERAAWVMRHIWEELQDNLNVKQKCIQGFLMCSSESLETSGHQ